MSFPNIRKPTTACNVIVFCIKMHLLGDKLPIIKKEKATKLVLCNNSQYLWMKLTRSTLHNNVKQLYMGMFFSQDFVQGNLRPLLAVKRIMFNYKIEITD